MLNARYHSFDSVIAIANVDGSPGDEVITVDVSGSTIVFSASHSGAQQLLQLALAPLDGSERHVFAGKFNTGAPTVLLLDDRNRFTTQYVGQPWLVPHSLYAH
ncbi:MAG: hypothetical protein WKG01_41640 [Kofleriaceae bacterium]